MRLHEVMKAGEFVETGSYEFTAERIVYFARQFDPQYFHVDAEKARDSVFGGLCASGWHICSACMKANVENMLTLAKSVAKQGQTPPKFGPSPGFRNLKWLKPVMAGDTVTYYMRFNSDRPVEHRPGRHICDLTYEGVNQRGETVLSYDCTVVEFE